MLDEVTVDLDVVTRMDLLEFFKEECEQVFTSSIYLYAETQYKFEETATRMSPMQNRRIADPCWK